MKCIDLLIVLGGWIVNCVSKLWLLLGWFFMTKSWETKKKHLNHLFLWDVYEACDLSNYVIYLKYFLDYSILPIFLTVLN
jgi:hypothetical protein